MGHIVDRTTDVPRQPLDARLDPILTLLARQPILERLAVRESPHRAELVETVFHRQSEVELARRVEVLSASDVSHLLEMLPPDQRRLVWQSVKPATAADVLWEVTDQVADGLVAITPHDRLLEVSRAADPDALNQIARHLPQDVLVQIEPDLEPPVRSWIRTLAPFPPDSVGRIMARDLVVAEQTETVRTALKMLRRLPSLPDPLDAIEIVDDRDRLVGRLPIRTLLMHRPAKVLGTIMNTSPVAFSPHESADVAVRVFEREDLVTAPVVDDRGRLVGRLTVDAVMHFVRAEAESQALIREGLSAEEDLFAPILQSARRRWLWLSVNLLTAFIASRVIGVFEDSIEQLVALATLMPIVASVGGNTGNQTVALFIRGLALDQIRTGNIPYLARKEIAIGLINGTMFGAAMGVVAMLLYQDAALGAVMWAAMVLNLIVAAVIGIAVPVILHRMGRDPAFGSSVLLTFSTDSMGFMIFLGLATAFLM